MNRNIWLEIKRSCLLNADNFAETEDFTTADTARAVRDYVETAIAIEKILSGGQTEEKDEPDDVVKKVIERLKEGKGLEPL